MKYIIYLTIALCLLVAFGVTASNKFLVTRVVDGDTIKLEGGITVRLLGIDTPESVHPRKPVECYGPEASKYLKDRVLGEMVHLKFGVDKADRYGRMLAYVYMGRTDINQELVKKGYAYVYPSKDYKTIHRYLHHARKARGKKLGLWGACYK